MARSQRLRGSVFLGFLLGALGCSTGGTGAEDTGRADSAVEGDGGMPSLVLGTGDAAFVAVADGSELELVHGPQGGYHVIVSARLAGFDPEGTVLTFGVYEGASTLIETPISITTSRLVRDGVGYLKLGDFMIFPISGPSEIVGHAVQIRGVIRRGDTVIAMDSLDVTVVDRM